MRDAAELSFVAGRGGAGVCNEGTAASRRRNTTMRFQVWGAVDGKARQGEGCVDAAIPNMEKNPREQLLV